MKNTIEINTLEHADLLVISNALNIRNIENWTLPTPSAFTEDEIKNIVNWIEEGGSLFLIADHMPFPGAAFDLAEALGFKSSNGFAYDTVTGGGPDLFTVERWNVER